MIDQIRFYFSHSLNDLRVSRRLTGFALLSIAAGVAAIVSLQLLGVSIGDALTGNLQQANRGDVSATLRIDEEDIAESAQAAQAARAERLAGEAAAPDDPASADDPDGAPRLGPGEGTGQFDDNPRPIDPVNPEWVVALETSFFGQSNTQVFLAQAGVEAVREWIAQGDYAGRVDVNARGTLTDFTGIFTGNGTGTALTDPETGDQATQVSSVVIDPTVYPFYDSVRTRAGEPLAEVLDDPTDIVVDFTVAEALSLSVGDTVQVSGSMAAFTVTGIVDPEAEVKNPVSDIFLGLYGYYYLLPEAVERFGAESLLITNVYFRLDPSVDISDFNDDLLDEFTLFNSSTTLELEEQNEAIAANIRDVTTVLGLVALLLGSIGIVNTMQVVVRRRMLEIAVLKTVGLQANQVTLLFLTEAFLMGILGSFVGMILGWAVTFGITQGIGAIYAAEFPFRIALVPSLNGFIVGVLVTTTFGFLPTLSAGQVRPGLVIQPNSNVTLKAGRVATVLTLIGIMLVIGLIALTVIPDPVIAFGGVVGAFFGALLLFWLLNIIIWVVGRLVPAFGFADLKISLRQMLAARARNATTLLALVVGVFSLSLITLFADSVGNLLEITLETEGNTLVSVQNFTQLDDVEAILSANEAVESYNVQLGYNAALVTWTDSETGATYDLEGISALLDERDIAFPDPFFGDDEERREVQQNIVEGTLQEVILSSRELESEETGVQVISGRDLSADDASAPVLLVNEFEFLELLGVNEGDTLTYEIDRGIALGGLLGARNPQVTFEIVGTFEQSADGFSNDQYIAPRGAFPDNVNPTFISIIATVNDEGLNALRQEIAGVPGTFVIPTSIFLQLIESLIGIFTFFPLLVAVLGLIVGGVVIANSVALATMERQQQIAIMKSVGVQRERVLGMLLLENALLGFIGGLIGVGIGLVGLIILTQQGNIPLDAVPFGSAFALMMLCILIALVAAFTSAWSASGEKPLTVLRYE